MSEWSSHWQHVGAQVDFSQPQSRWVKLAIHDDLQFTCDSTSAAGGGLLYLKSGTYALDSTLFVPSNISILGDTTGTTTLITKMAGYFTNDPNLTVAMIIFENTVGSKIENVTLKYVRSNDEPISGASFISPWDNTVFTNDPNGDTSLYVGLIGFKNAYNCLVKNCQLINAGTDPIFISQSKNISVKNCVIEGSYNKGGKGNGYFNIDDSSSYILVKNNDIRKIRHLAIQNGAHHNVVYQNYLEVDINFHNGDAGYNLIEKNTIRIPEWHGWHPFSAGSASLHAPPGAFNILFDNQTQYKNPLFGLRETITEFGDSIIYQSITAKDTLYEEKYVFPQYVYGEIAKDQITHQYRVYSFHSEWQKEGMIFEIDSLRNQFTQIYSE